MLPLVDTHCHLLAGFDDGPPTLDEAVAMCRMAWEDGTRVLAATSHVSERWPEVTSERIREGTARLVAALADTGLRMTVYPCAEVTVQPGLEEMWARGELLGMAGRDAYLLIELPVGVFLDLRQTVRGLVDLGVRPVLAHPERRPEYLHDRGVIEQLIELGCLVQVTSDGVTAPPSREDARALRNWFRRGIVHLVASDGHSTTSRLPHMAEAYRRIVDWAGGGVADRVCGINGLTVLEGSPLRVPDPEPPRKKWFALFR